MPNYASPYFAAIDLGSNSFHLLVTRLNQGLLEVVDREKEMVQLARGLTVRGKLSVAVQQRAIHCLLRFAERLRNIPATQIRVVGTKALRSAVNAEEFLRKAEKALGHKIEIISGYEEARLVYQGLAHCVANDNNRRLVIDIGGGSTEFIIGRDLEPKLLESLNIGCISGTKLMVRTGDIDAKELRKVYLAAAAEIEQIRPAYVAAGWDIVYGTSGTMRAVAELLADQDGGAIIRRHSLMQLVERLGKQEKLITKNMPKLRRDILPAGIAIIQAIFDQLNIAKIHVADATLKEGLIYDLMGRLDNRDARLDTVAKLQTQYQVDRVQAQRVTETALHFWHQITGPLIPAVSRSKILTWAAMLHEVGLAISHAGHHLHGHYILRNSDLAGFGRYEQYILAELVRGQRKKILGENRFEGFEPQVMQALIPLLVCLRLSVLLHRKREKLNHQPLLKKSGKQFRLVFPAKWLDTHPLTRSGLELEAKHFSAAGLKITFK